MKQIFQTCWPNTLTFINCHWYKVMTCGLFIINQCDANFLYLYIICYGLQACCGPQTCFKLYIFYHWPWRGQMTLIHVTHCLVIRYLISLYIVVVNQTHIFNFSDITNFELGHISFGLMQDWIQGVGGGGWWWVEGVQKIYAILWTFTIHPLQSYDLWSWKIILDSFFKWLSSIWEVENVSMWL